jgi:thioredoxin reductase (NADPH)
VRNVVIMGSGPAGLTAAIYAGRANLFPLLIEGHLAGGQLSLTTEVENYPGFRHAIMGPELMQEMRAQAERFGAELVQGNVTHVDLKDPRLTVSIEGAQSIETRALIIASGATPKMLGLASERRLLGHGVSTCATCDGFFFKGKELVVVGGGDTALEEAIFLTKFASNVTVIHRRDTLRASKILQDRALRNPKISFIWNAVVDEIIGDPLVIGVQIKDILTGSVAKKQADGVFIAIGHSPNTKLFEGQLDLDSAGYIKTHNGTKTSVPGVFAAGDVQDSVYRQAITAAGSGCMAAIDCERYLESSLH